MVSSDGTYKIPPQLTNSVFLVNTKWLEDIAASGEEVLSEESIREYTFALEGKRFMVYDSLSSMDAALWKQETEAAIQNHLGELAP